jgi:hypothetical protein
MSRRCAPALVALLLPALLVGGCSTDAPPEEATPTPDLAIAHAAGVDRVDHIMVAVDSLERGIELLRVTTGITATFGGVHPGRGTQNALISLGPRSYLELIAPNPADERGPETVEMYAGFRSLTPAGWAARADDADAISTVFATRGLPVGGATPGSRVTTAGDTIRWKTLAPWPEEVDWSVLPFFIEWVPPTLHPATTTPTGCTLAGILVRAPTADTIRTLLRTADLMVDVEKAETSGLRFELDCPTGRVVIGAE